MKKGFIGPIGDDLPSIIALMLALGLFFSSVTYTLNIYNQKVADMEALKGSIEIGRAIMDKGILQEDIVQNPSVIADYTAKSYALNYAIFLDSVPEDECIGSFRFSYLAAVYSAGEPELRTMILCTWK